MSYIIRTFLKDSRRLKPNLSNYCILGSWSVKESPIINTSISNFRNSIRRPTISKNDRSWDHGKRYYNGRNYYYQKPPYWEDKVVYILIGSNVAVFLAWQYSKEDIRWARFMMNNFTITSDRVFRHSQIHTIFTSMFSHKDPFHLFSNMFTLYFFGSEALAVLGAQSFLRLYFTGGIIGGLSYVLWPYYVKQWNLSQGRYTNRRQDYILLNTPALGASGAVSALVLWGICSNPRALIFLYGIVPVPAALFGVLFLSTDLYSLYQGHASGGSAHLGGAIAGTMFFVIRRFR